MTEEKLTRNQPSIFRSKAFSSAETRASSSCEPDDSIELYVVAALVGYDDIARKCHRVNLPFVKTDLNEHHDVASPVIIERTVIIYAQNQESFRSVRMQRDDQHQQHGKENEQHTRRLMAGKKRTDVGYFILHMS